MTDAAPENAQQSAIVNEMNFSPNYLDNFGPAMLSSSVPAKRNPDYKDSGGLLGRWSNVKHTHSSKGMVDCAAARPQYEQWDFLKPCNLPAEKANLELNYLPGPDLRETRFHRGFQRRQKCDIRQDEDRLIREAELEWRRDTRDKVAAETALDMKKKITFDVLTGEGVGREGEFKQVGKRIINPCGDMNDTFMDHSKEDTIRMRASQHRFGAYPWPEKEERLKTLVTEGLQPGERQSMIIGYGEGVPRCKHPSYGVADNFAHLRGHHAPARWEETVDKNRSQIILG